MRGIPVLILTALNLNAAAAEAPLRRPILVSAAAQAVVVEARAKNQFWFERCYLPNDATKSVEQQVARAMFRNCARFSTALPDDDAARGEFNREFSESINDQFEAYGRQRGNALVVLTTVGAALVGGTLPLLKIKHLPFLHSATGPRMLTAGTISGLLAMVVSGWYSLEYADDFGLARDVKDALDSDLTTPDVIYLDKQVRARSTAAHAIEAFQTAIADAARATLQGRSN